MARILSLVLALSAAVALASFSAEAGKTTAPIHLLHPRNPHSAGTRHHAPPPEKIDPSSFFFHSAAGRHHAPPPGIHTSSFSFHSAAGPSKHHHHGHQDVGVGKKGHHHLLHAAAAPQAADLPAEPYPGFYECLERLTPDCGAEIYRGIFGQRAVTARCCGQLVEMGQRCHRNILKATMELPQMKKIDRSEVKARDVEIWSQCAFIASLKAGNSGTSRLPILP